MSVAFGVGGALAGLLAGRLLWARSSVAKRSIFFLNKTLQQERELSARVGCDLAEFLALAQRVMWGITQPDLIHVDVEAVCRQLGERFPAFFATHLLIAFAARARGNTALADQELARARELLDPANPLAYIMPTAAEWAGGAPEVEFEELVPGMVWRVPGYFSHGTSPFAEFMYATVIRRSSGQLLLINPVSMAAAVTQQVRALGEVTHIVVPVKFHSMFITEARATFPSAKLLGVHGHRVNPPSAHLSFDGFLDDRHPLFPEEVDQVELKGHQFEETALYHRASRTAILTDVMVANQASVVGATFWFRLYAFVWGIHDTVGLTSYSPMMITNIVAFKRSLTKLLSWDAERVLIGHAGRAAIPSNGRAVLRQVFGAVAELGPLEHLLMLAAYFRRQPGFMRDFVTYLVKQRQ